MTASVWSQSVNNIVKQIRSDYIKIENHIKKKAYTQKTVEYSAEQNNQYGSVALYSLTGVRQFKRLYAKTLLNEENLYELYFYIKNDRLFFAYWVATVPNYSGPSRINHVIEKRYYFHNGRLVKYLYRESKQDRGKSKVVVNSEPAIKPHLVREILGKYNSVREILKDPETDKRVLY
jgi:hypothetical protein